MTPTWSLSPLETWGLILLVFLGVGAFLWLHMDYRSWCEARDEVRGDPSFGRGHVRIERDEVAS